MDKRQLLFNALIAVALSALHRIIEESALLAMRFTAGKHAERSKLFEPYLHRHNNYRLGSGGGSQAGGGQQQRPASGQVVIRQQPDPAGRKRDPYAHIYDHDPYDERQYG